MQQPLLRRFWYLSTQPGESPTKPRKVRRVNNAAWKFEGVSLNGALLTGPDVIANLLEIILCFRKHPVDVLADIEGMYMQVAIREADHSALRFLWLDDGLNHQSNIETFAESLAPSARPAAAFSLSTVALPTYSTAFPTFMWQF